MIKVSRRAAAAAAAVLALGVGSATWASASASAATAKPAAPAPFIQRCTANDLAVWVNADSANGAAGTIFYHLDVTNTGHRTCYLFGWPSVSATNSFGHQLGAGARRVPNVPARIVNVRPGGTAHAVLGYVDVQVSPACHPTTATFLKVSPPNSFGSRNAFFPLPVCTDNTRDLTIGLVQSGA